MNENKVSIYIAGTALALSCLSVLYNMQRETGISEYDVDKKLGKLATKADVSEKVEELTNGTESSNQAIRSLKTQMLKRFEEIDEASDKEVNTMSATLKDVVEKLSSARSELNALKVIEVEGMKEELTRYKGLFPTTTTLAPTDPGYSILWSSHGPIAISIEEVTPHLSGSMLTVGMINLAGASLKGTDFQMRWGNLPKGVRAHNMSKKDVADWVDSAQVKGFTSDKVLPPGSQVLMVFYLEGFKHDTPGIFYISDMKFSTINYTPLR